MNIRVKETKGGKNQVTTLDFKTYLYGAVAGETYNYFNAEALKAQTVASATLAMHEIMQGKASYDIEGNTNDQTYSPEKINNLVIEAVDSVFGQFLLYDAKLCDNIKFCDSNGGHQLSGLQAYNKYDARPYLAERLIDEYTLLSQKPKNGAGCGMSQWGAQYAALNGLNYQEILAYYYNGVEIKEFELSNLQVYNPKDGYVNVRKTAGGRYLYKLYNGDIVEDLQEVEKGYRKVRYNNVGVWIYDSYLTDADIDYSVPYVVLAGGLNMRSAPSVSSKNLGELAAGSEVKYYGSKSGIYQRIKLNDGSFVWGWYKRLSPVTISISEPQTEHFNMALWETQCEITDESLYPILQTLMNALEVMRERSGGREIVIHSGYRTKQYHQNLNPGTNSMHCYAGAADISFGGDTSKGGMHEIGILAKELYDEGIFGGLGLGNSCVHVDVRGRTDINGNIINYNNLRAIWFYNGYKNYEDWLLGTI